jgi:ornithine cyclodeaminase/alanine dehydrogenase
MTLLLTRGDLVPLIDLLEVVEAVEQAHRDHAIGAAVHPDREGLAIPGGQSLLVPMVSAMRGAASVKVMTDTPPNRERGKPTQQSLIVLVDGESGCCEAILDGGMVTRVRTAATSAVATRHLAPHGAHVLGLIGAGGLAHVHVQAIRLVRELDRVLVWSRTRARASELAGRLRDDGVDAVVCEREEDVVRGAGVVCTLTPSRDPHVQGSWLTPGQHINAVGAPPRPDHRELDSEAIRRSRVVSDSWELANAESGDVLLPMVEGLIDANHFRAELGQVIAGQVEGRRSEDEITVFNSVGMGIQDLATARVLVRRAQERRVGTQVSFAS